MNFGGAAQGYLDFVKQDQARAQQAQQMSIVAEQLQAFQRQKQAQEQALGAQQKWGSVLQGMMGGQQPQPGMLPPPPGTMAGGPMPPGPGVSSAPPPGPQMPPGAIPPPPGAGAPPMGGPAPGGPPAQPTPPYKPMPTTPPMPPVPGATGAVPPPPAPAQPPGPPMGGGGGQQFGLPQIIEGLKKANVPPEQWGVMLDNLPEPVKNNAAQEIKTMKDQQNFLIAWANSQTRAAGETRRTEQGDRKLDQGDEKIRQGDDRNATAKQLAEAKIKYMEAGGTAQFDATDKQYWAEILKSGGSLPPGLARDPAGRKFVQELMRDVSHGDVAPKEMMSNQAEFMGHKAAERTLGNRQANVDMAVTEAQKMIPLALKASADLKRTNIRSINDLMQNIQSKTASPELRRLAGATNALINIYARAVNPTGATTQSDKDHAREVLDKGFSDGDYQAAADQLMQEMGAAKASPDQVRTDMRESFVGGGTRKAAPQEAIDYLKAHPELSAEFSKKYGYVPAGARGQ